MNTGDTYFKEGYFPVFKATPLVFRKLITERRKLVLGYIDDIMKFVVKNGLSWKKRLYNIWLIIIC